MPDAHPPHAHFLGFDFGTAHIGVAVGQHITRHAQPLATIHYRQQIPWRSLLDVIDTWQAQALVVGLPTHMDGGEQWITRKVRSFAQLLHQKSQRPVYLEDERLTSCAARETVFAQRGYRGLKKAPIDSLAAVAILNQWLQRKDQP